MAKMLSPFPRILCISLDNQIIPSYGFIWNLFKSDEKTIATIKRFPDILGNKIEKYVAPNITILKEHGVSDSNIAKMLRYWPESFSVPPCDFRKIVEKVLDLGFNALKPKFVLALHVLRWISESRWKSKVDAYKKWGFSEEDVLKGFKKCPWFLALSEDKLMPCMDFFINQMGWRPCLIAESPVIITQSLKKRIVPRCSVFQVLLSKGLVGKDVSFNSLLNAREINFLQNFVTPYVEEAPEILKLYKEKLDLLKELEIDDKV